MGLMYAIGSHAYATLEFVDGSEDLEEGRTYRVSFVYVQTEGIDDFGDLAYNPTFFTNAVIPVGCGFS